MIALPRTARCAAPRYSGRQPRCEDQAVRQCLTEAQLEALLGYSAQELRWLLILVVYRRTRCVEKTARLVRVCRRTVYDVIEFARRRDRVASLSDADLAELENP